MDRRPASLGLPCGTGILVHGAKGPSRASPREERILTDLDYVAELVTEAGKRALGKWGAIAHELKADASMVTEVDRETELFLRQRLSERFPSHAFVGEEFGWLGDPNAPVWACDPIDGTTNYVRGLPQWGVSVGLIEAGEPRLGAIYLPVLDDLYLAEAGRGATCNRAPIHAVDRSSLHVEDTICLTSNSLKTLNTEVIAGRIRCFGSIAAELAGTARGNLAATVGLHEGIVDIAAALCIGREAGCAATYLAGPPLDVADLLRRGRTTEHFVFAPPRITRFLLGALSLR